MAEVLLTSPTLLTSADTAGRFALQATISAAGPCAVSIPHALPVSREATIGVALWLSARPSSVTVTITYTDPSGGALPPAIATLTADEVNRSVDRWERQVVHLTAPPGAATVGTIKVKADTLPASGALRVDEWTIEQGYTSGDYFDGNILGGQWLGTPELSASVAAPIVTVADGECPLDVPVSYQLANPSVTGGRMTSQPATLDSQGRTWITHPSTPNTPISAKVRAPMFDLNRNIEQGVFRILDSPHPVVVSSSVRSSPAGQLQLLSLTFAERDALLALFTDGTPVLLRAPANVGLGEGWWVVLGSIVESANGQYAHQQKRVLSAPFQVVEAPAGSTSLVA